MERAEDGLVLILTNKEHMILSKGEPLEKSLVWKRNSKNCTVSFESSKEFQALNKIYFNIRTIICSFFDS